MNRKKIVVLSPHSDDAALSVGGFIRKYKEKTNISIITVFNISYWAPNISRYGNNISINEIPKIRPSEDKEYGKMLGVNVIHLNLQSS